jgi:hypothetical protein
MEHGQKAMSLSKAFAVESRARLAGLPVAALPARFGRAQIRVNRGAFPCSCLRVGQMKIQSNPLMLFQYG